MGAIAGTSQLYQYFSTQVSCSCFESGGGCEGDHSPEGETTLTFQAPLKFKGERLSHWPTPPPPPLHNTILHVVLSLSISDGEVGDTVSFLGVGFVVAEWAEQTVWLCLVAEKLPLVQEQLAAERAKAPTVHQPLMLHYRTNSTIL